jgi:DNA-directed RNA polymerase subunit M
MMFCPKCGGLLLPKKENNRKVMHCKCGYNSKQVETAVLSEKMREKESISVVEKELEPHPLTQAKCPKCPHRKAYFWTVQTRASDEPETKFLKCEKCEHVWRDYS